MDDIIKFNERIICAIMGGTSAIEMARTVVDAPLLQHRFVEGGSLEQRLTALESG